MKKIRKGQGIAEVAAIVSEALRKAGVIAVLSGGGAVSIYSDNEYESSDLDFVTSTELRELDPVMAALGFTRQGRHYEHPRCAWLIEFPPGPLMLGGEAAKGWSNRKAGGGIIRMLTPTQCVMDRLAAFYHWNDRQCLDQAVMVARRHRIDRAAVGRWSRREGHGERYKEFVAALKRLRKR